ncbi:MAG: transposase, partial [Burkholderia sp.]
RSPSGSALATCRLIAKSCLNNRIRYRSPPNLRNPAALTFNYEWDAAHRTRQRLEAIRADLARMPPFVGEGARQAWARLRIQDGIGVSRAHVSPLMHEHGLLSPHRRPQKPPNAHNGRIAADRPNEMWGADGTKVQTVDEGLIWIFAAVDHCDAARVGIHTSPRWATALPHWS